MKHLLIILSFLLLSSPVIGQSERPETIIIPVSGIGDVSNTRKHLMSEYSCITILLSLRESNNDSPFLTPISEICKTVFSLKYEMRSFGIIDLK